MLHSQPSLCKQTPTHPANCQRANGAPPSPSRCLRGRSVSIAQPYTSRLVNIGHLWPVPPSGAAVGLRTTDDVIKASHDVTGTAVGRHSQSGGSSPRLSLLPCSLPGAALPDREIPTQHRAGGLLVCIVERAEWARPDWAKVDCNGWALGSGQRWTGLSE